jgi:hypothetical protein
MDIAERYFEDAVRIYAICGDENLSDDEARLLTYIHVKVRENSGGPDFFDSPDRVEADALGIMLGDCMIAETMVQKDGTLVSLGSGFFPEMSGHIHAADEQCLHEAGMENRISGELRNRLRLHRDQEFRRKMVSLYTEKIAPRIFAYDKAAAERSFNSYREKTARREQDLQGLLND